MKIAAVILSCLVLALSAGVGRVVPQQARSRGGAIQTECCRGCGCCGGGENDAAAGNGGQRSVVNDGRRSDVKDGDCIDAKRGDRFDGERGVKSGDSGSGHAGSHGNKTKRGCCPFCAGSFAKGLSASYAVAIPPITGENHTGKSLFICRGYVPPFVGGIWQPPRSVS